MTMPLKARLRVGIDVDRPGRLGMKCLRLTTADATAWESEVEIEPRDEVLEAMARYIPRIAA